MRWIQTESRSFWREAQEREIRAWENMGFGGGEYLARRGAALNGWVRFWCDSVQDRRATGRVLEIGGAGLPTVDFLEGWDERHGVDPLMEEYERMFGRGKWSDEVRLQQARGEELPFPDGHFAAVVMLNVLDHVDQPEVVLNEIARVLDPNHGVLFFSCDTYGPTWLRLRALRVALRGKRNNDLLHPHHFTHGSLLDLIAKRYRILESNDCVGDAYAGEGRKRDAYPPPNWRERLKREARTYITAVPR